MKATTHTPLKTISPQTASAHLSNQNAMILDVRTVLEFSGQQVPGSLNLPLDQLSPASLRQHLGKQTPTQILIMCQSGNRACKAAEILSNDPAWQVQVIEGGLNQWQASGLPVDKKASVMTLERQVRIAAGLLILTGIGLARWVHPWGIGLSGFVGAGLVFAGITDTCGMGMLLAKAPWNRRTSRPSACAINP